MILLKAEFDNSQVLLAMQNGQKRLAYAMQEAINATMRKIQQDEFDRIRKTYHIRAGMEKFWFGGLGTGTNKNSRGGTAGWITQFAQVKNSKIYAEMTIRTSTIQGQRRLLLPIYEAGGPKKDLGGNKARVAIPITGTNRPSMQEAVPEMYRFSGMKLTAYVNGKRVTTTTRAGKGKVRQRPVTMTLAVSKTNLAIATSGMYMAWRGANGIYLTHTKAHPEGVIKKRFGPGKSNVKTIWVIKSGVQVDPTKRYRLRYAETAIKSFNRWWKPICEAQIRQALVWDRGKTGWTPAKTP